MKPLQFLNTKNKYIKKPTVNVRVLEDKSILRRIAK